MTSIGSRGMFLVAPKRLDRFGRGIREFEKTDPDDRLAKDVCANCSR